MVRRALAEVCTAPVLPVTNLLPSLKVNELGKSVGILCKVSLRGKSIGSGTYFDSQRPMAQWWRK